MNQEQAKKFFISQGLRPGTDFTIDDSGIVMTPGAKEHIKSQLRPESQEQFESFFETREQDPWKNLEEYLGVAFFDNLKEIVSERIQELTNNEALDYLGHIIQGFEARHPQFERSFAPWLIQEAVGLERWNQISCLMKADVGELGLDRTDPNFGVWMIDLIRACGGNHHITKADNGKAVIHKDGIALLEEVFTKNQN